MKRLITVLAVLVVVCVTTLTADAAVRVRGYYRSNGTYVQPHYRSNPDGNPYNNWSTYPNVNPYTGVRGSKRFSTEDYSGFSLRNKPTPLPVYPSGFPGADSSWSKPSPLPYNPYEDSGRNRLLGSQ